MTKRAKLLHKLRTVTASGASFSDIVTLLEAYDFQRLRTAGSHWSFVYTDEQGNRYLTAFAVQNGKTVKPFYVKKIVELIDMLNAGSED